ncbi:MAG: hypothetical protein IJF88_05925 [Oscillospiraceae bacterium]|nr:hypothetical protein [Oscillospiraceae bacterium]
MAGYGRPLKGKYRRVPTTVHIPTGTLDIIDDYLEQQPGNASRSDFIVAAIDAYLKQIGLDEDSTAPPAE